ncbi:NRDE family protein [Natronorubrum daqingense]|uniref:Transport and Golgi organisation 2 n=1 Tax=Natronorubrum daqingense TaxID=588898 RepID=A0A1N6XDZ2_9EURY|nr:NRDE family protein [Natronorubrum daqingense]APX95976.1 hypothetical protein BB347_04715 [Natronorubrum daqingense]SIR00568.1 Transport and Golgi organisation 2 [Natronorubrum daqingense]
MCTLTLAWRVFDDAPVAVAANRDEAVGRPSEPPGRYRDEPAIVAPRDAEAGGTWIGYNEFGVFAGITNKWTDADLAGDRSRGLLVADVLSAKSAVEAAGVLEAETADIEYDGFYLVIADETDAYCYEWDGTLSRLEFEPGVHVVVNVAVDDRVDVPDRRANAGRQQADSARAVRDVLSDPTEETAAEWLERAGGVLADHDYGVCLHENGYGTRSSSLIALGSSPTRHAFAPGPPCETAYEPVDLEAPGCANTRAISDDCSVEGHI